MNKYMIVTEHGFNFWTNADRYETHYLLEVGGEMVQFYVGDNLTTEIMLRDIVKIKTLN